VNALGWLTTGADDDGATAQTLRVLETAFSPLMKRIAVLIGESVSLLVYV
jgi:hypothetical protein